jgi:hypothetical protein
MHVVQEGMQMIRTNERHVRRGEEGHVGTVPGLTIGAAGAIALGIGAASGMGWLAITGGVVLAVGIFAASVLNHMKVDYDVFARLEKLEKK